MSRNITVTFEDGTNHVYRNAPDDITPDAVQARAAKEFGKSVVHLDGGNKSTSNPVSTESEKRKNVGAESDRGLIDKTVRNAIGKGVELASLGAGIYKGVGDLVLGGQKLIGQGLSSVGADNTGKFLTEDAMRRQNLQEEFIKPYKQFAPDVTGAGEFGGEVLATLPVGGVVAKPVQMLGRYAPQLSSITAPLAQSLKTGGFNTGLIPKAVPGVVAEAVPLGTKVANKLAQTVGGATVGGISSALINPAEAETGAIVGGVLPTVAPPVVKYIAAGVGKIIDAATGNLANVSAGKIAREAAGDFINQIRAANGAAPLDINAAQAAYGIENDTWQAFLSYVSGKDLKSVLSGIKTQQGKDQFNLLANMARGATEAESKISRGVANETLNKLTTPMKDVNVLAANVGKNEIIPLQNQAELAKQAAAAKVEDVRRFGTAQLRAINPAPNNLATDANLMNLANSADETASKAAAESLVQGEIARNAEAKIADLTSKGLKPLDVSTITGRLSTLASEPGTRANEVQVKILNNLNQHIKDVAAKANGVMDVKDLYEIRKTGVNDVIESALASSGLDPKAQKKRVASLLLEIRPLIDDAIEKAGGKTWRDYLSTHAAGMKQIEGLEMADKLRTLFTTDKKAFVKLVEGNDIAAVQEIFGPGNFDIAEQMMEKMKPLVKIKDEITRDARIEEQIKAGTKSLSELKELNKRSLSSLIFGFVGAKTAATKKGIEILENRLKPKVMETLVKGAESGKSMNEILNTLPADDRFELLKAFKDMSSVAQSGTASLTTSPPNNKLTPQQQNQNALAR
jgi:hypothetical protein